VVHHALGAGEYRVVVGQHQAARLLVAELRGVDAAQAADQAVRRAAGDQFLDAATAALRGNGQRPVLDEAAVIEQVGEVLAGGALADPVAFGDGFRAVFVEADGVAFEDFGEVGADRVQVNEGVAQVVLRFDVRRLDEQQGVTLAKAVAGCGGEAVDDAAGAGLHLEFHLHRFDHGDGLALGDGIAGRDIQAHQHPRTGRGQRDAAGRRLADALGLRCGAGMAEESVRVSVVLGTEQRRQVLFDVAGGDLVVRYRALAQQVEQQRDVACHALQAEFAQGAVGALHQLWVTAVAMDDQLGQQRIVAGAVAVAGVAVAVHAQAGTAGRFVGAQGAAGQVRCAIAGEAFQVDPQLQGVAARRGNLRLGEVQFGEAGAASDAQLRLYQVDAGHRFGDGVFHLQARVGFHEHEVAAVFVQQEFESAQAAVVHRFGQAHGGGEDGAAQAWVQVGAGGNFQQLLVAPLQGAIALPQVADDASITNDLHLDVPGALDQALDVETVIAERRARFSLAASIGVGDFLLAAHRSHASPSAAGEGLDHHAGAGGQFTEEAFGIFQGSGAIAAGGQCHAVVAGQIAGAGLVAEDLQHCRRRADKRQAGGFAAASEVGVSERKP
jgi:hypothetical protein